jgi:hypothetical protein
MPALRRFAATSAGHRNSYPEALRLGTASVRPSNGPWFETVQLPLAFATLRIPGIAEARLDASQKLS